MEVAGIALGTASLTFQVFEGIIEAFEVFESAIHADAECETFRLILRTQYARLYTWGAITGLADKSSHNVYDRKMRNHRVLVSFILGELERLLKRLRKSELRYENIASSHPKTAGKDETIVDSPLRLKSQDIAEPSKPRGGQESVADAVLTEAEWAHYESLFGVQSAQGQLVPRAGPKGFGHAIFWLKGAVKIAKQPKRIVWAVRDSKSFASDLDHVKELVDYLHETVSDDQMQIVVDTSYENNLLLLQLAEDIKALQGSIQPSAAESRSLSGATLVPSSLRAELNTVHSSEDAVMQATFAKLISFMLAANAVDKSTFHENLKIKSKDRHRILKIEEEQDEGARALGTLQDQGKIWVEWKPYVSTDLLKSTPSPSATARVEALAELLAMEKPEEFSVPRCARYFIDTEREAFGLVFQMPAGSRGKLSPTSLFTMLNRGAIGIQSRIAVAQQISQSLLYLHAVNWLHKGVRSSSILFFPGESSHSLGRAHISGFEYSRVVESGTATGRHSYPPEQAVYIHPAYLDPAIRPQFKKTFDMYSLGVVLVEIACWNRIEKILKLEPEASSANLNGQAAAGANQVNGDDDEDDSSEFEAEHSPPKLSMKAIRSIRSRILDPEEGILNQVEAAMGPIYRNAVYACVKGMEAFGLPEDKDQANPVVGTLLQHAFIREVVDPLRSIQI